MLQRSILNHLKKVFFITTINTDLCELKIAIVQDEHGDIIRALGLLENVSLRVWVLRQKFLQNTSNSEPFISDGTYRPNWRMLLGHELEITDRRILQWKCRCSQNSRVCW